MLFLARTRPLQSFLATHTCNRTRATPGRITLVARSCKGRYQPEAPPAQATDCSHEVRGEPVYKSAKAVQLGACLASLWLCGSAGAATHGEPGNALSVPTWIIHISSVIEWTTAMFLMWRYAEVTGNERWKGMTWGMLPLFTGALTACTYHFFYNNTELDFLVALQALLTWIGNATLWIAAYRIYDGSKTAREDAKEIKRS